MWKTNEKVEFNTVEFKNVPCIWPLIGGFFSRFYIQLKLHQPFSQINISCPHIYGEKSMIIFSFLLWEDDLTGQMNAQGKLWSKLWWRLGVKFKTLISLNPRQPRSGKRWLQFVPMKNVFCPRLWTSMHTKWMLLGYNKRKYITFNPSNRRNC